MPETSENFEQFVAEATAGIEEGTEEKERQEKIALVREAVKLIVGWATDSGIKISAIKRLGGGFEHLVLLVTSQEGKSFVMKTFTDSAEIERYRQAQQTMSGLSHEDEQYIPQALGWIKGKISISAKAEGQPVRSLIKQADVSPENFQEAVMACTNLGRMLGRLYERTERQHDPNPKRDESSDQLKDLRKIREGLRSLKAAGLITADYQVIEKAVFPDENMMSIGQVALLHGDAHLDQFFYAPDRSDLTIVDYDSIRYGDPMADLGRILGSIRLQATKFSLSDSTVDRLVSGVMGGYRQTRHEDDPSFKTEFDQKRVLMYELRTLVITASHMRRKLPAELISSNHEFSAVIAAINEILDYLAKMDVVEDELKDAKAA